MSLAMRHRAKMLAQQQTAASAPAAMVDRTAARTPAQAMARAQAAPGAAGKAATEYELQLAGVGEDLRSLKSIQSIETKIERKAQLLPNYDAWCEGVLEAARAAEDDGKLIGTDLVLVETMIWAIDCGDWSRALPRIRTVLRHGMDLPQRFDRTIGCMVAEECAEGALKTMATDQAHIPDLPLLLEIADLTEDHDMPDQARAKLHKAIGMTISRAAAAADEAETDPADLPAGGRKAAYSAALKSYQRALALDAKSGVKKMIEQADRELAKLADATG